MSKCQKRNHSVSIFREKKNWPKQISGEVTSLTRALVSDDLVEKGLVLPAPPVRPLPVPGHADPARRQPRLGVDRPGDHLLDEEQVPLPEAVLLPEDAAEAAALDEVVEHAHGDVLVVVLGVRLGLVDEALVQVGEGAVAWEMKKGKINKSESLKG